MQKPAEKLIAEIATYQEQMAKAGAKITLPDEEMFCGDRYGLLEDPFGHRWSAATPVRDMSPKEIQQAA